jgi:cytochrome c oxidase subunit II
MAVNTADQFNFLFGLFTYLAVVVGVIVFGLMAYFIIKYREKPNSPEPHDTPILGKLPASRGHLRSVIMTVSLSTIILAVLIVGSFAAVDSILTPPRVCPEGCSILVTGHQFYWDFTYPNGTGKPHSEVGILRVPVNQDIRLNVTSADVFHDFGIIGFSIKTDAIPGRYNTIWFHTDTTGTSTIQCFELCGSGHAGMKATLVVLPQANFTAWYNTNVVH